MLAAASSETAHQITDALFNACWRDGQTLTTTAEVLAVIDHAGIDTTNLATTIDVESTIERLEANNREAAERDVFGSPSFLIGDALFFGSDRLDFVQEHLSGVTA